MDEDPRAVLSELVSQIRAHFEARLQGLYLFGSLATGDFYPGRSDLDLVAVLATDVAVGDDLDSLRKLHERFEDQHPEWRDRIEVLYLSRAVLATFVAEPTGVVARISPGEPLHHRDLGGDIGWLMDWHGVLNAGETLIGPAPAALGPVIDEERWRSAVRGQLRAWHDQVRERAVAYVPAHQGYIVATVCRALYSLATGSQASKERAVAWYAEQHPELAGFLTDALRAYRADRHGPHRQLIRFVDDAAAEGELAAAQPPPG